MKYIAKQHPVLNDGEDQVWFDAGTEAELLIDFRKTGQVPAMGPTDSGLFKGIKDGHVDEEICAMDEFDEVEG